MEPRVFDDRLCALGEGPLWHPDREQLFWVDIVGQKLRSRKEEKVFEWTFDVPVSALGWIDHDNLLIAGAGVLMRFNIESGSRETICRVEPDWPDLRTNDGRADPKGGFWIGTMGRRAEPGLGTIYRYYRGELRALYTGIDIPNATCFSPDGKFACFADSRERIIWRQALDRDGWPTGDRTIFLDLRQVATSPDGAIFDADGFLWVACWAKSSVARYAPNGLEDLRIELPVSQITCPAFGGPNWSTLFVTTAQEGLSAEALASQPLAGAVFAVETGLRGQPDPRVIL